MHLLAEGSVDVFGAHVPTWFAVLVAVTGGTATILTGLTLIFRKVRGGFRLGRHAVEKVITLAELAEREADPANEGSLKNSVTKIGRLSEGFTALSREFETVKKDVGTLKGGQRAIREEIVTVQVEQTEQRKTIGRLIMHVDNHDLHHSALVEEEKRSDAEWADRAARGDVDPAAASDAGPAAGVAGQAEPPPGPCPDPLHGSATYCPRCGQPGDSNQ